MASHLVAALSFAASLILPSLAQEYPIVLCAEPYTPYSMGHLISNIDNRGSDTVNWETTEDNFIVTIRANSINFKGDLKPKNGGNKDKILTVDLTFRDSRAIEECYCSSQRFLDLVNGRSFGNPKYYKIEKLCSRELVEDPETNPDGLLWCPKCESDECGNARRTRDSPNPVYLDWQFYTLTEGSLGGEGLEVFRDEIRKFFPVDPSVTECTPVIDNLPLAQFGCSNLVDPDSGFGYGANGKNQKCGFASWFNCAEDLSSLGRDGQPFNSHTADINLNIIPCPPTPAPTPYPTWSPTTPYPSASPTTECDLLIEEFIEKKCVFPGQD